MSPLRICGALCILCKCPSLSERRASASDAVDGALKGRFNSATVFLNSNMFLVRGIKVNLEDRISKVLVGPLAISCKSGLDLK